jgi:hypothetical protein
MIFSKILCYHTPGKKLDFETRNAEECASGPEVSTEAQKREQVSLLHNLKKETFMTMRRTFVGLALCVIALTLFMGCVEPGPPPMPPPMVETPPPPPSPPHYFVTVSGLALREGPTTAARQVGTLEFNDEVMVMETSSGWARVEDPSRNRTGWASMRYLQPMPASRPQHVPRRRSAPAPNEPPPPPSPKAM